jgi:hypothetical protein
MSWTRTRLSGFAPAPAFRVELAGLDHLRIKAPLNCNAARGARIAASPGGHQVIEEVDDGAAGLELGVLFSISHHW